MFFKNNFAGKMKITSHNYPTIYGRRGGFENFGLSAPGCVSSENNSVISVDSLAGVVFSGRVESFSKVFFSGEINISSIGNI
jgi:hypothetical protein